MTSKANAELVLHYVSDETPLSRASRRAAVDVLRSLEFVLTLDWRCENCGWSTTVRAPGFAGDGYDHFPDGHTPCGPLVARRARG